MGNSPSTRGSKDDQVRDAVKGMQHTIEDGKIDRESLAAQARQLLELLGTTSVSGKQLRLYSQSDIQKTTLEGAVSLIQTALRCSLTEIGLSSVPQSSHLLYALSHSTRFESVSMNSEEFDQSLKLVGMFGFIKFSLSLSSYKLLIFFLSFKKDGSNPQQLVIILALNPGNCDHFPHPAPESFRGFRVLPIFLGGSSLSQNATQRSLKVLSELIKT